MSRVNAVIVAEAEGAIGTGISARNSEVIHGGMYYPAGSLRARHCVAGAAMLAAFCDSHGVAYRRCGKLIVATADSERDAVAALKQMLGASDSSAGADGLGSDRGADC